MTALPVLISARAKADIRRIRAYIAARSPANAEKFIDRLRAEVLQLGEYGEGVAVAPESSFFRFELKQIVVWPYRVLFRVHRGQVRILHIRHGNRMPAVPDRRGNPI